MRLRDFSTADFSIFFSLLFIWSAAVLDPIGNFYGLRYISYFFCINTLFLITVKKRLKISINSYQLLFIIMFGIAIPLYGLLLFALFRTSADLRDTSYIAAATITIISMLYNNDRAFKSGLFAMIFAGYTLALIILFNAMCVLIFKDLTIPYFFVGHGIALIGSRSYGSFEIPYIYFVAAPFLIPALAYYCEATLQRFSLSNISSLLLIIIATILTGTRAASLFGFLTIILILFSHQHKKNTKIFMVLILSILISYVIFKFSNEILTAFSLQEGNNSSKFNDLKKYATLFDSPRTILFGQGFNAHDWSELLRTMIDGTEATKTELTYFEILRVFGLPFGIFIIIFLFLVAYKAYRAEKYLGITFFILLLNASFNPYLFSTNGMLPIGLIIASFSYRGYFQNAKI